MNNFPNPVKSLFIGNPSGRSPYVGSKFSISGRLDSGLKGKSEDSGVLVPVLLLVFVVLVALRVPWDLKEREAIDGAIEGLGRLVRETDGAGDIPNGERGFNPGLSPNPGLNRDSSLRASPDRLDITEPPRLDRGEPVDLAFREGGAAALRTPDWDFTPVCFCLLR